MQTSGAGRDTVEPEAVTPIWISQRTRRVLMAAGVCALALILWRVTTLVSLMVGGAALAIALSFPVDGLSRVMPRGAAIALSFLLVAAVLVLAITVFAPIIADQLGALVAAVPGIAQQLDERVPSVLDSLAARGHLPGSPERVLAEMQLRLVGAVQRFAERLLGGLGQVVSGVAGVVVALMGIMLVAVTLLANARRMLAAVLLAAPHRYRRDVRSLWGVFGETLSRYLGGLTLSLLIEGALAAIVFHLIGLPYAFVLGAWVSVTAVIPYVSAWIGYAPAVLLALAISPTRALLALALGITINAVVGNVITPRIQGRAVHVHPMLVFFAVVAGGELFGIPGVILAVPAMAVLRVLSDFFRVRVRVVAASPATEPTAGIPDAGRAAVGPVQRRSDWAPALDLQPRGGGR
jgi:predicted PurR-regulated permease PerM